MCRFYCCGFYNLFEQVLWQVTEHFPFSPPDLSPCPSRYLREGATSLLPTVGVSCAKSPRRDIAEGSVGECHYQEKVFAFLGIPM